MITATQDSRLNFFFKQFTEKGFERFVNVMKSRVRKVSE